MEEDDLQGSPEEPTPVMMYGGIFQEEYPPITLLDCVRCKGTGQRVIRAEDGNLQMVICTCKVAQPLTTDPKECGRINLAIQDIDALLNRIDETLSLALALLVEIQAHKARQESGEEDS